MEPSALFRISASGCPDFWMSYSSQSKCIYLDLNFFESYGACRRVLTNPFFIVGFLVEMDWQSASSVPQSLFSKSEFLVDL
jgi:hypothetical protein